jgi:hypothetical protein
MLQAVIEGEGAVHMRDALRRPAEGRNSFF